MKKFVAVLAVLLLPMIAYADVKFGVDPLHFGLGALSTWLRDAGEPNQAGDPQQYGLYLAKHTATSNLSAAQAAITGITPMPATDLEVLAFDISGRVGTATFGVANGYCGAGAPRFSVTSGAGTSSLGCIHGDKVQDPVTGWWEISFIPPFTQYPGSAGITGTITRIRIIFDEGTDSGAPGDVVIDNIRVNDEVVGKPLGE